MGIEGLGFVIGLIGAFWMKSSLKMVQQPKPHSELNKMLGREEESPALKAFMRGLVLVLFGLGLETYARLFLP